MGYFMPSKKILKNICKGSPFIRQYTSFPLKLTPEVAEETVRSFMFGIMNQIAEYYKWALDVKKNMNTQKLLVVSEALNNSLVHGAKNKGFMDFGLFLAGKGVCYGFKDEGDYFKKKEVKEIWENKKPIKNFGEGLKKFKGWGGGHIGAREIIYKDSDMIEIDTKKGVLYCVQFKESLEKISPL